MRSRCRRFAGLALLSGGLLCGVVAAPIRIGFAAPFKPVGFLENGRPAGFTHDYLQAVARAAGWEIELVTGEPAELDTLLERGEISILSGTVFSAKLASTRAFSLPNLTLASGVFARSGQAPIRTVADLAGRKLAITPESRLTYDFVRSHPEWGVQIVHTPSTETALRSLQSGENDLVISIDLVAQDFIRQHALTRVERSELALPDLVYKSCLAFHPRDHELLRQLNEAHVAAEATGELRRIYERWIGPLKPRDLALADLRPLLMPSLAIVALIAAALGWQRRNLTRLSRQTAALRRSEERLNLVLEAGRHCLWDWQVREDRVIRSPTLAHLLGYRADEIPPVHSGFTGLLHSDDVPRVEQLRPAIDRPGHDDFAVEVRFRSKSGAWQWFAIVGRVVQRAPDGGALRVVGTHTDITARKEAEDAVRHLNTELERRVAERTAELATRVAEVERLNSELEAFSYSASHDLRAPLRNITGFLELLAQRTTGRLEADAGRYLTTVVAETARMGLLIDDLLTFSRLGRAPMKLEAVQLAELIDTVRLELAPDLAGRMVEFHVTPLPLVEGDRALLQLVISNLLGNAVKFTRRRERAVIEIGTLPVADGNPPVTVFIRDNGAGFNPKYVEKLFGVFQRLHNARDFAGTGIGLANVKRIITRHGGRVWAEGAVDQGATFYFTLKPADDAPVLPKHSAPGCEPSRESVP